jgi:hypothetical protein
MVSGLKRTLCLPIAGLLAAAGVLVATPASAAVAQCHYNPPWNGTFICAYGYEWWTFSSGVTQLFVIGTDYSVWTRWNRADGSMSSWVDLGGTIWNDNTETNREYLLTITDCTADPQQPILGIQGTNKEWYYNNRKSNGDWTGWARTLGCRGL